jgi:hypothetical protein
MTVPLPDDPSLDQVHPAMIERLERLTMEID